MRAARFLLAALACGAALDVPAQAPSAAELFARADEGRCAACHRLPQGIAPALAMGRTQRSLPESRETPIK